MSSLDVPSKKDKGMKKSKGTKSRSSEVVESGDVSIVVITSPEQAIAEQTVPGRTCKSCQGRDTNDMVQCDECDKWHHFGCVGVTEEVANHSWSCPKCVSAKWVQRAESSSNRNLQATGYAKDCTEKQEPRKSKHQEGKDQQGSTPIADHSGEKNATDVQGKAPSIMSSSSSRRSSRTLLKLQLQRLEEEKRLEKEFLDRKYTLLEEMASEKSSTSASSMSRVRDWVVDDNIQREGGRTSNYPETFDPQRHSTQNQGMIASVNHLAVPNDPTFHPRQDQMTVGRTFSVRAASNEVLRPYIPVGNQYVPEHVPSKMDTRFCYGEDFADRCPITKKQLAARQAISKDLPNFSGKPEEWPLFFSSYTNTTAMCGFTDAENVVRLQKSLTGKAYDAVKCRLMHPTNVNGVTATLRMRFGQPEAIVHSLIAKITALPALREDKLETIMDFAVEVQNFCSIVDACKLEEHMYNVALLHQLVNRLPPSIKLDWARYRQTLPRVNLATFGNWIYSLAEAASTVTIPGIQEPKFTRNESRPAKKGAGFLNAHLEASSTDRHPRTETVRKLSTNECLVCRSSCKGIDRCKQFLELSRDSRWAVVKDYGLCRRCLRKHNGCCKAKDCGKDGCTSKHHELLHNEKKNQKETPPEIDDRQPRTSSSRHDCNTHRSSSSTVLFRYLPLTIRGKNGFIQTFAFLDEGSGLTLVDQDLADELGLGGMRSPLCLRWTGGTERCEEESRITQLTIAGTQDGAKRFNLDEVRTVKELQLPHQSLDMDKMKEQYPHLRGLPIESYEDARPRILIGLKHAHVSLVLQSREGKLEQPIAIKTRLGWTVCGGSCEDNAPNLVHYSFHVGSREEHSDEKLHQAMKEYFALDSLGVVKPSHALLSSEDQRSCKMLESLTTFNGERYATGLLWRYDDIRLPDSRPMALRRYCHLQSRMRKDPELAEAMNQKITDYLAKEYIRKLTKDEEDRPVKRAWYLLIFPVFNPNKPGKVRIVWDAAATIFGVSLNSALLKGPDQLCSLLSILLQFREYRVGLTGDIREMFHQVQILEKDRPCQRFFWEDESGEMAVYEMCVMTFGACCSPSSAQYVKNVNAERFSGKYPRAVEAIIKQHYVDDMLVSVDSEDEAIKLAQNVKFVQGGFEIRNWITNSPAVLAALGENEAKVKSLDLSAEVSTEKVLGLWWCTETDTFTYKVGWARYDEALLEGRRRPTKREVLRVLMSIFDPLGLIAHFLIYLKILLQEIWRSGVQWDDKIDDILFAKWQAWLRVLPEVEKVQIPRCYYVQVFSDGETELHTFVDASENGFAAVSFLRFTGDDQAECILVAAKTRVAPLKFQSIPRLELQAAVLGARIAQTIADSLSIRVAKRYFWTDSRDVLCWINSDHRRFTQFVAHRVSEILDTTEATEWRWVPSKENVADDATKWQTRPDLTASSRWFNGPKFLRMDEADWPQQALGNKSTHEEL